MMSTIQSDVSKFIEGSKVLSTCKQQHISAYIAYMYTKSSTSTKDFPTLEDRKKAAKSMFLANIDNADDIVSMKNSTAKDTLIEYLKEQDNLTFSELVAKEEFFEQCINILMKPFAEDIDEDKEVKGIDTKMKISSNMTTLREGIAYLKAQLFGDNDQVKVSKKRKTDHIDKAA